MDTNENKHFVELVYSLLVAANEALSEFQLLKQLEHLGLFDALQEVYAEEADLLLFKKHFLIKNALYQLQKTLWQERQYELLITPLEIFLKPYCAVQSEQQSLSLPAQALADYYLNWDHYYQTDARQVDDLLGQFWQRFFKPDELQQAYECLGLQAGARRQEIKSRFRTLAQQHHPDKGGEQAAFLQYHQAYQLLIKHVLD